MRSVCSPPNWQVCSDVSFRKNDGCGFENTDIKVVEAHEKTCTIRKENAIKDEAMKEEAMPSADLSKARKVLEAVMEHEHAEIFSEPVDWKRLKLQDYPKAISRDRLESHAITWRPHRS